MTKLGDFFVWFWPMLIICLVLFGFLIVAQGCQQQLPPAKVHVGMSDFALEYSCEQHFPPFVPQVLQYQDDGTVMKVYRQHQIQGGDLYLSVVEKNRQVVDFAYHGF